MRLSASPVLVRTSGQWMSHHSSSGVYASSASTSNRTSNPIPLLRCSSNSQQRFLRYPKFYIIHHSRHTLTLPTKVNIIPIYRGKSWRWIPGLLSKVWTCSYKTTAAWLPTQQHTSTPGSANPGELEQRQSEITSTNRPMLRSEKR